MRKTWDGVRGSSIPHRTPQAVVAQLELTSQISFDVLLRSVEAAHGKPIAVRSVPGSTIPGLSGLWLETEFKSHILVPQDHSELHRRHVICHELGHILLQHEGCDGLAASMPSVFNHVGQRKGIKRMLARSPQWNDVEKAAEEVAYLLSRIVLDKPTAPTSDFEKVFG
ncbi:ImmA/IrrE family metallo-endopeptidase [Crystallibacter crystallopoietes]|uniref:ImmA/IrrE family metallo-endopeptidase n=1 Tax=Crystallibacter crystallopoietes TaxID=37928 RepID=UPI0012377BE0|nr:ImmA/IrrE family metallo-endopeptidase [Arthrobacter crystallopoietes]